MRGDLPTGTVTFLFTDVEGSTRLLHELGAEGYAEALAEHRRVIREACAAQGGVEVDTQGDAFLFVFPTAPGALTAAAALTEALLPRAIRVRVGLHTGTPLVTDEGYVGDDLHRAARIAAAGHGGQVLVSASTASLVEFPLADLGEHRFKDLGAPERVYQLGHGGFPSLKSLYRTNLPVPATPFFGRERELTEVAALVTRDDVRLLTFTGPGGTGKTRLALQAAAEAAERFPDGIWWVPLAPLRDPSLVLPTVAQRLEVKEESGKPLADTLADALTGKQTLILLDNAEHLLPDIARDLAALGATDGPLLLVTSRERLRLQGEQLYPVPTLVESDGVTLFLARARALQPAFKPNGAVSELCLRLDNLPLALELAAARTVVFSPEQLLGRLSQRLDLLEGGRAADSRQHTLRTTIEWSYDLLSDEEQRLFRSLSVFAGGCTFEAAEDVCGADPDTLQSLLDKSLIRRRDTGLGPRYWMLETICEFAVDKLAGSDEESELRRRHTEHFLALARVAEPELKASQQAEWLERLELEHDNIRLVLERARAMNAADVEVELAARISWFWHVRGRFSEGRRWLEGASARDERQSAALRSKALLGAANLAREQGDLEAAKALAGEALGLFREADNSQGVGAALNELANIAIEQEDLAGAADLMAEALVALRRADDQRGVGIATSGLGYLALTLGDADRAVALHEESLDLQRELGNPDGVGLALLNLGFALLHQGDLARASDRFVQSIEIAASLGRTNFVAYSLEGLAAVAARQARMDRALRLLASATTLRESIGAQLDPVERDVHERTLEAVRAEFPPDAIEVAHEEARSKTVDEAVEDALGEADA